mmetsp:Transcript_62542/g.184968  ORF Transcript_62542/g.184968 Transcript_62542/m.184968 type:complete len:755 (-) Transcript_62542:155-2419(-)|eukprot:CAMPEP_0113551586 /NCGR_PEP_ID=MMETSP0015_2-20120614/14605_1 /TAXON_ID=2838 /ORGANISM="Odontella" /LENGTH=754 /DNA_ID=CAMNT_0000452491 /DNA_START=276 /DNA_END=2540 /DNA_ORIENTATION=- /assembly_acc=CAM_ASM_000160
MTVLRSSLSLLSAAAALGLASATDLGGGVNTITDVSDRADIVKDLADMFSMLEANEFNDARNIYTAGKNSKQYDKAGNAMPEKRTLAGLSTSAARLPSGGLGKFDGEPPFLTHINGLTGGDCADPNPDAFLYAHRAVEDLIQAQKGTLAFEAARALNLWMYATHELYDGVDDCARLGEPGVNAEAAGLTDNGNGAYAFEEFMAFWIGNNQAHGSDVGFGLYAMAQQAGRDFGTFDSSTGEAKVNSNIKNLFVEMQGITSNPIACKAGSDTAEKLWGVAHRIVAQMSVPLVQMLLKSMREDDPDRVRLYARSIIPQMSRCRPSVYRRLKENLLDRSYDNSKYVQLLGDVQNMLDCLGVSCEDVGAYKQSMIPQCAGYPVDYPIAEFSPTSNVHEHAKFDLDVAELKLLTCFGTEKSYTSAERLYMFGHNTRKTWISNSVEFLSLREMATSTTKDKAPWSTHYTEYHQNKHHADKVILDTLNGRGKWGAAPPAQRAETIAKTVQYQVVFQYTLGEMSDAVADCSAKDATDNEGSVHSWDEVVSYYIGSLEGIKEGGSKDFADGQMMWNLGNKRCTQFGTENSAGWSVVMAAVEDLFYAGKGQLDAYDCANLQRTVRKVEHLSLIPLIQSVMRYAIKNEQHSWDSPSKDLAEGEAFAMALLPILAAYDPVGQSVVEENMVIVEGREPVVDGAQAVADAFDGIMHKFGLQCQYIGESDGVDSCNMSKMSSAPGFGGSIGAALAVFVTIVSSLVLSALH